MIKAAIVGYGNIGKAALQAVLGSRDFELLGIIRRNPEHSLEFGDIAVVGDVSQLREKPDVVILAVPTRLVEENAEKYLSMGINTVDSFDIHPKIWDLRCSLDEVAKKSGAVAIVSAGWDPGTDSCARAIMEAIAPKGITYTNFGPGMSMGHSVAVKAIEGVKDAMAITVPMGTGIHRRMVYVELCEGYNLADITKEILADDYFKNDETHVIKVENINEVLDKGHGVNMSRKGVSGGTDNQRMEFSMTINNPAATAQVMVSAARASFWQATGAYTLAEIPPIDLLEGTLEERIKRLV